ncbi:InlB B-repeat-containing protein [uncultured Eubacterium sp.]|uniref:InlB B-repeat-containing protein n=1 Tax=uncultured Eubacterium sp. TaxID=165185 RepID=UPI0025F2BF0B|nr:InlB B-repeat-containing protein [uncultured Eubacterium sp.]
MKKRILSILLAVCMTVCFVPTQSVYAESKSTAQSVARQSTCPPHNYNTDKGICKICNYQCPHTAGWDAATRKCNECKMEHRCISYVDNISIDTGICGTCGHLWAARFHKGTAKYLYKEDSIINKCINNDIKGDWKNDAFLYIYVNVSDTLSFGNKGPIVLTSPDTVTINEIVIENGSEITLNGGVFNKVTVKSGGKLTVNGGTIKNLTKETGSTVIGNAIREVSDVRALNDAFADSTVGTVKLRNDISIDSYIQVRRAVTLDLNGYVLGLSRNKSIIVNNNSSASKLTLTDSNPNAVHKFTPDSNGVWALDETNGTKTVKGGVITGGNSNGNSDCGGAMSVGLNGTVIMEAGNIVGCQANGDGGAIFIGGSDGAFIMNGGNIVGCRANNGGALYIDKKGTFTMTGGTISDCITRYDRDSGALYVFGKMNANGGSVDSTVTVEAGLVNGNLHFGIIRSNGDSGITEFKQNVINLGEIEYGHFYGTVTVGDNDCDGAISGGTFNDAVTVNSGKIKGGVFNKDVTVTSDDNILTRFKPQLIAGTYNALIRNYNIKAEFDGACGTLGIVGENPIANSVPYHKATFDTAGGTMDYSVRFFCDGIKISEQIKPTRAGYTFDGWYKSDGTEWNFASDTVTDDTALYAKWTANTYTVTFDCNDGVSAKTTATIDYNREFDEMPVPKREGYVFLGWYDALADGKRYGDENGNCTCAYDKAENITLYAQWSEAPSATVHFFTNGGAMTESDEVLHKLNTPIAKPDDPDKTGYTFGGWYTDAACIQAWNFDDWVTEELTLYAGWTVNQYTVVIKPENGDEDIVITQDYGTQITAPSLTKDGYTFIGWDMDFPVAMPAEDITITAQWKKTEKPTVKPEEKTEQKADTKVNNIKKAQTKSPETGSSALAVSALSITAGVFILGRKKRKK